MPRITAALLISACAGLAACATSGGEYPNLHYARAAEAGPVAIQLAGRPTRDELVLAEERWGRAIADAYACRINPGAVSEAAMVGALELAAMSGASRGRQDAAEGVMGYLSALGRHGSLRVTRPGSDRCARLTRWIGDVRHEGRSLLLREAEDRLLPPG